MDLKRLKKKPVNAERRKRVGRGTGSGLGKTCGRGSKGAKSRSGYSRKSIFEGGQMPLIRRIPKRGFNNTRFAVRLAVINVGALNAFGEGAKVDEKALREKGLVRGRWDGVKVLGHGELNVRIEVTATKFSRTAMEKIAKAGGTATLA
jgi:large subunit ribosomal protein L15